MSSREIEAVFPPTPLQQGLLFHSLSRQGEGVYVTQHVVDLLGEVESEAFGEAWQGLVDRHQALRSCFRWRDTEKPLTIIRRQAELPIEFSDWSDLDENAQQQRLEQWLVEDKRRGFRLDRPPLFRLRLIRRGPGRHWLYWANHHAILDGWSAALLATEALTDLASGGGQDFADDRPQWTDYLRWLQQRHLDAARSFWRETLAGIESPCALDLPRPAGDPRPGYGRIERRLSELLCSQIADTARACGTTPAVIAQAAWALVLDRYGGGSDVVFGSISSGRPPGLPGVDRIAGLFINTLPLRVRLSPTDSVRSLFAQVSLSTARMREHEYAPLSLAVSETGLATGSSLFDTLMVFENYPVDERLRQGRGGLRVADVRVIEETNYPLSLVVGPGRRWTVDAIYRRDRLSESAVEGLVSDYLRVLSAIARNPDQRVGELTALRCDIVTSSSGESPASFDPSCSSIVDRIADQTVQRPEGPAVRDDAGVLSYAELERHADRLETRLAALGAGPEAPVAIALDPGVATLVGILGALRAGAPYWIVGTSEAEERLNDALKALTPRAIVTIKRLSGTLPSKAPEVLLEHEPLVEPVEADRAPRAVDPANVAYVLFTSGSTGGPKGVQVTHGGLTASTAARFAFYRSPVRSFLLLSPFSFDSSVAGIFWTLASGGELVIPNEQERRDPERIADLIQRRSISHLLAVPSLYELVLEAAERKNVPAPEVAVVAGEACPENVVHRHFEVWPSAHLVNEYGPTEATVWATAYRCSPRELGPPPIGRPIPGMTALVLDRQGRPSPVGVPGELLLGGEGLARGYLDAPALTASRFQPHPFGGSGERLYRTGDRVRRLESGDFEFLGRLDRQVKLRGQRIELEEIERAILAEPQAREAAVELIEDDGPARLAGFVRLAPDADLDESEVLERLRRRLPGYMVPATLVLVDDFHRNRHGKIDRARLPRPEPVQAAPRAPADEIEARVARSWSDVLQVQNVGCDDSFFDAGGDSLGLMRLAARLRREFDVEVELSELLEADTVSRQADRLRPRLGSGRAEPTIPRVDRDAWHPLSSAQQRMWFFTRFAENAASAYNIPVCVELRGEIEPAALESAFRGLIERHETFRTRFRSGEDGPQQRVEPRFRFDLDVVDLREEDVGEGDGAADALESRTLELCRRPFDLDRPPLLRAHLLRLGDARRRLVLVMPHLVADGWSSKALFSELTERYRALRRGRSLELEPPALQPVDYAVWEQGRSAAPDWEYWRETLREVPALELPADRARGALKSYRGQTIATRLAEPTLRRIRAFATETRSSFFVVTLAFWRLFLGRLAGQDDFCIGVPVAEREQAELQDAVGLFLDAAPIRVAAQAGASFRQFVGRTREAVAATITRPRPPLEQLLRDLQISPDPSRPPLFQVFFAVHQGATPENLDEAVSMEPLAVDPGAAKFDLTLSIEESDDEAKLSWEFDRDQFEEVTVREFAALFAELLDSALEAPDAPAASLAWLNAEQSDAALRASSGPAPELPDPSLVHALVEGQAIRRPSAAAVSFGDRTFSYRELDRRANAVARRLIALGVEAGDRVAVGLDRSLEQIVAVLGVLKTGAAYAPFDSLDPAARIEFLLDDLQVRVIACSPEQEPEMKRFSRETLVIGEEQSDDSPEVRTSPDQLACVLYTSGSTGRPKGVAVSHRSVVRLLTEPAFAELTPEMRMLVAAPLSFDASTFEIWGALVHGGCCLLTPPGPPSLDEIRKAGGKGADTAWLTSSLFSLTVDEAIEAFAPYRQILTGGEALSPAHVRRFRERYPDKRLVNGYGPTECTTFATSHDVGRLAPDATSVPIGKPVAHTVACVLDDDLRPAPVGVVGELYLGGLGLARGYWSRPGLTAEAFVPNPLASARPGERLYRTGDLARRRTDGRLDFVGRSDRQVKIKGRRIEVAEIEAVLASHPDVRSCAVAVRREAEAVSLVAYVTPQSAPVDELAAYLASRLPAYMAPDRYVALEKLPLTRNGKVDLKQLPAPAPSPSVQERGARPASPMERRLLSIWRELLGDARLGVDDDVFRAGADSLISIRFAERAARKGIGVDLAEIFRSPTVRSLARVARTPRTASSLSKGGESKIPLSPSQALFFGMEHDNPHHYNLAQWFRAEGELTPKGLAQAAQALGTRHDALRLRFDLEAKTVRAAPQPGPPPVEWIRLRSASPAERRAELEQAAVRLQQSLRIDRGPLYRLAWFQGVKPEESLLLAVVHHLAADGASLWILGQDLQAAMRQALEGRTVRLGPPPALRWSDWAEALAAEARTPQVAEWLARWRGLRSPAAAGLGSAPAHLNRQRDERSLTSVLDPELSQALERATPEGVRSVPYLLAAGVVAGISRRTRATAHAFDWVSHGRDPVIPQADPSRTVGYFTARTPVTLNVAAPEHAREAAASLRAQLEASPFHALGFGLARYLSDESVAEAHGDFSFNFIGDVDTTAGSVGAGSAGPLRLAPDLPYGPSRDGGQRRVGTVHVFADRSAGRFRLLWRYSEALHRREWIQAVANESVRWLQRAVGREGGAIAAAARHGAVSR